ncbi:MAG: phenylalanine--tRNA ligase subunit beta, partial [Chitinophagaceae bacterium]
MTISYNWLSSYLPVTVAPERLSHILTSIGLEVESMEPYEAIKGGLKGLVIGQVLETAPHPNADKLVLTQVTLGGAETLQIVCGAPNVAAGQKVIVAPEGSTIFPKVGEPMTMKNARIRGMESHGMICAEDEIGFGDSHAGILVLPDEAPLGASAADYFQPYEDIIYEIGLTPNRSDAMSHWGVARDVCAYLSHHDGSPVHPARPKVTLPVPGAALPIQIIVENSDTCPRYSGICIAGVRVAPSPRWLQDRLQSIGVRPINNIVDITNFILHETGQPLHAFDYDAIEGRQVIVKNAASDTPFKSLDSKVRTLSGEDLMICNTAGVMCIAGVFGGFDSGVSANTTNIFLESAFFD